VLRARRIASRWRRAARRCDRDPLPPRILAWVPLRRLQAPQVSPIDSAFGEDAFADDDEDAPEVVDIDPVGGTPISKFATFSFSVLDDHGIDVLKVEAYQGGTWETVFEEGAFCPAFKHSTVTPIDDGFRFVVRRTVGWFAAVFVRATVTDTEGTEAV
jgi:hypothetical protein